MNLKMLTKALVVTTLLTTVSPMALAKGGTDSGGAHGVGNQLFDFYENEGTRSLIMTDDGIAPELKPAMAQVNRLINKIEKKVPMIAFNMREILAKKRWYLEPKKISCVDTESMIDAARKPIACQDRKTIRLSESWLSGKGVETQAGVIYHEIVRGVIMSFHGKVSDESGFREYVRQTFKNIDSIGAKELSQLSFESALGHSAWLTADQMLKQGHRMAVRLRAYADLASSGIDCDSKEFRTQFERIEKSVGRFDLEVELGLVMSQFVPERDGLDVNERIYFAINGGGEKSICQERVRADIQDALRGLAQVRNLLSIN